LTGRGSASSWLRGAKMVERFDLEGVTYYREYRKCGKANCGTCQDSPGHGPYWYARDWERGGVTYHGKELPECVLRARACWEDLRGEAVDLLDHARERVDALKCLLSHWSLCERDREILRELGLGGALVASWQEGVPTGERSCAAIEDPGTSLVRQDGQPGAQGG
jgi:hypothetical protein